MKMTHALPEEIYTQRYCTTIHCGNLIASHEPWENELHFLRIPPATSVKPIVWWCIPFPFLIEAFGVYPADGILAVAEEREQ